MYTFQTTPLLCDYLERLSPARRAYAVSCLEALAEGRWMPAAPAALGTVVAGKIRLACVRKAAYCAPLKGVSL